MAGDREAQDQLLSELRAQVAALEQQLAEMRRAAEDRKPAEDRLRESEERYRRVVETMNEGLGITDAEFRFTYLNNRFCEMLGYTAEEVIGRHLLDFIHEDSREFVASRIEKPKDIEGRSIEIAWVTKDGRTVYSLASPRMFHDDQGRLTGSMGVVTDITDRKAAEESLRASEATYRSIFNAANDAIFVHDPETGAILDVNEKMCEMYGYGAEESRQLTVGDISSGVPPYTQDEAVELVRKAFGGTPQIFEWLAKDRSARLFWVEVNLKRAVIDGADRLLAVVRDISDRKQAEGEHRRLESQIQHTQKLESLGVLAGGIAHDFNNLLVAVLGNADLALRGLSRVSPVRSKVEGIRKASIRAAELVNQMLAYSGRGRFVVEPLDLNELVREMAHLLEVSVSKKIVLKQDFFEEVPLIKADAGQVRQIVMNLITNASDAIGDRSGAITIRTGVTEIDTRSRGAYVGEAVGDGPYVLLEVSDTGCGMDEDTQHMIFDPFFTTKFAGRGLGLAAVLGIVRGHDGAISVTSAVGKGTTFRVLIPPETAAAVPSAESTETRPAGAMQGTGTVLFVDDEESVRSVVKAMLENAGFTVLLAADGVEGVSVYREHADAITVVLLDMTMPRMGGEEAFREMRAIRPDAKVVLCSGYTEQDAIERFTPDGLAGFLQKPFQMDALVAKIRSVAEE